MHVPAENIGILAIEAYIPPNYVCQGELEAYDGVPSGKYTLGLGQVDMAFCDEDEDTVSMALTALHGLLETHSIDPRQIGRLEVGTETSPDRSKSIKSHLMPVFTAAGNHSVQGVDCVSACFGGTAAVLNAVDWMEGRAWDGRLAIVVAADAAMYPPGPARASGGAGAVAMLIGPDAPLVVDRGTCALHMEHSFDFHKPIGCHFPQWDGPESLDSYLRILRLCYSAFCDRFDAHALPDRLSGKPQRYTLKRADYAIFHAPFNRMARKAIATLAHADRLRRAVWKGIPGAAQRAKDAVAPGAAAKITLDGTQSLYNAQVDLGTEVARHTGNAYTASLWGGLASLVNGTGQQLEDCQILLYSYGSGAVGCLFTIRGRRCSNPQFHLKNLAAKLDIEERLLCRTCRSPADFTAAAAAAEARWALADWLPFDPLPNGVPTAVTSQPQQPASQPASAQSDDHHPGGSQSLSAGVAGSNNTSSASSSVQAAAASPEAVGSSVTQTDPPHHPAQSPTQAAQGILAAEDHHQRADGTAVHGNAQGHQDCCAPASEPQSAAGDQSAGHGAPSATSHHEGGPPARRGVRWAPDVEKCGYEAEYLDTGSDSGSDEDGAPKHPRTFGRSPQAPRFRLVRVDERYRRYYERCSV
mmetsp:Transcript_7051/g.20648  ORF Transcript_7051/g.20648 Transcript_7051/m.20648 type:complete len:641 (-) Transcript_7051:554-2476(-)